jgi:hypothetical protein
MGNPIHLSGPIYKDVDDYTLYIPAIKGNKVFRLGKSTSSCDTSICINDNGHSACGRALACWCNNRQHVSVTIRLDKKPDKGRESPSWTDPSGIIDDSEFKAEKWLDPTCERLFQLLFGHSFRYDGLIVVSGRTGSAKSKTTRGLIYKLLHDKRFCNWWQARKGRRPHLITLEDPIESALFPSSFNPFAKGAESCRRIDYTARDRSNGDYSTLQQAFRDALRQTPAVFYVGEVREKDAWSAILDFAGTGHLVFTTTHAGSVVETFSRIFDATEARTAPALQGIVASRILGVIHQENVEVSVKSTGTPPANSVTTVKTKLLPALWRNTPAGVASLIAPGLSSILPNFEPKESDRLGQVSSFGRRYFNYLLPVKDEPFAELDQAAFARDLSGI